MSAYDSARYHGLLEQIAKGDGLNAHERALFEVLDAQARAEWETAPPPRWEGGHPDMF